MTVEAVGEIALKAFLDVFGETDGLAVEVFQADGQSPLPVDSLISAKGGKGGGDSLFP
jgi:hypothetical protein